MNFNKVILGGYFTRDPELRYTPKGTAVCQFSIGCNRTWTNDAGERQQEVTFIECTAWGKTSETVAGHFRKGSPILIEGYLKMDSWDDKQTGHKRTKLSVVVERFSFVSSGEKQDRPARTTQGEARQSGRTSASPPAERPPEDDDDVPF